MRRPLRWRAASRTARSPPARAWSQGRAADPECFKPQSADTKFFQWPAKPGPYRIALVNGFIANDWRVQMIRVAKAYAAQPDVAKDIKEFKAISVGDDVAAQIAAVNNFIDQGFDAIIVDANSSSAFGGVVKKANDAGVALLSFDNVIDDPDNVQINVDQKGIGTKAGRVPAQGSHGRSRQLPVHPRPRRPAGGHRPRRGLQRSAGRLGPQVQRHRGRRQLESRRCARR